MKSLILFFILSGIIFAQSDFNVTAVNGEVKILSASSEKWIALKNNLTVGNDAILSTGKNSSVKLTNGVINFTLKQESAITVADIKKMNMDELLLALAVEEILDAPAKNKNGQSESTAVYGSDENEIKNELTNSSDFGFKRLNGAKQLSESGLKESAVVVAKEVYRKYPETKGNASFRIYFADILFEKGLYEEAMIEYTDLKKLDLTAHQAEAINAKLALIRQKLLNE